MKDIKDINDKLLRIKAEKEHVIRKLQYIKMER